MAVGMTLALLCLISTAHAFAHGLMDQAIQAHCPGCAHMEGRPADSTVHAAVHRSLEGTGQHRRLTLTVQHDLPPGYKRLLALQPLPAAVFADVYELAAAAGVGQGPRVELHGPSDVESIAALAQDSVLAVELEPLNATVRWLLFLNGRGAGRGVRGGGAVGDRDRLACAWNPPPAPRHATSPRAARRSHVPPAWPVPEAPARRARRRLVARRPSRAGPPSGGGAGAGRLRRADARALTDDGGCGAAALEHAGRRGSRGDRRQRGHCRVRRVCGGVPPGACPCVVSLAEGPGTQAPVKPPFLVPGSGRPSCRHLVHAGPCTVHVPAAEPLRAAGLLDVRDWSVTDRTMLQTGDQG